MPINLANTLPINEVAAEHQDWLSKLQGNILRSHGRNHSAHVFMRFAGDVVAARAVVAGLVPYLTSARRQHEDTVSHRKTGDGPSLFGTLSLSADGYRALGFAGLTCFEEPKDGDRDPDACFLDGMKAHPDDLADPPVSEWEPPFRERIDAMLLLAHGAKDALLCAITEVVKAIAPSSVIAIEYGAVIRNASNEPIEHFGFVDGRSQPLYLADDFGDHPWGRPTRERRHADRPIERWNPFEPLELVLRPDPFGTDSACLGSFLVFRKLEQDVRGFVTAEARLAATLGLEGPAASRASAMVVGRFRDGSPLALAGADGWHPKADNDFTYADDRLGWRCPFHSHVRRVNPRGSVGLVNGIGDRARRLTRRGVPYGAPSPVTGPDVPLASLPDKGVGMLFMAYQSSIRRQFAFVQKRWVASPNFPLPGVGVDPLIVGAASSGPPHKWRVAFNDGAARQEAFGSHVRMLGGEFFFTPSLPFLRTL